MKKQFPSWRIVCASLAVAGALCGTLGMADEEPDSLMRTWTNKNTGTSVEARATSLTAKNVKLQTATKKTITMPLEKLTDEDIAWLTEHKDEIGKSRFGSSAKSKAPSGPLAKELQGKLNKLVEGKLKKEDGHLDRKCFILYYSASWCGPCRANAPHSVEAYNKAVKDNPNVEVIMCSCDNTPQAAENWAAQVNMPWPILYKKDFTPLVGKNMPKGIPTLVLVDSEGKEITRGRDIEALAKEAKGK